MRLLISALLLVVLAAPVSALTTASQSTDGGVTIRPSVSAGAVLDPGDGVSFQYQSARDGALVVFDIDTQGYVTLLTDDAMDVRARETGEIPSDGSQLFAEGEPGVEFVFAVAVSARDAIDPQAFNSLRDGSRRITGDPFIAANMIAAELVSNISQHTVFIGYTYFYVSDRVEYPCYLCGTCDGGSGSDECAGYRIVQDFDRSASLRYPLERGYNMIELASEGTNDAVTEDVAIPSDEVDVNFYPYGSEVHYADPIALNAWYDWGWYDPYYWYYPGCYPYYYSPGWSFSIGFGWGWGWGYGYGYPGYYCSGWYAPYYGCGYYPDYPSGGYGTVTPYKTKYKSGSGGAAASLAQNRSHAMKKDGDLRVASKGVRSTNTQWAARSKSSLTGKQTAISSHRVKTSVSGARGITRESWSKGRTGGAVYKGKSGSSMYRTKNNAGKTVMERGNYRNPTRGSAVQRGGTSRSKSGNTWAPRSNSSTRSKGTWSAPSTRSAPRSGSTQSAPRMGSGYKGGHSAPAVRSGGGHSGGGRSMGSTGGGMRGGGGYKGGGGRGR